MSNSESFAEDSVPRLAPRPSVAVAETIIKPTVPEVSLIFDKLSPKKTQGSCKSSLPYKTYDAFKAAEQEHVICTTADTVKKHVRFDAKSFTNFEFSKEKIIPSDFCINMIPKVRQSGPEIMNMASEIPQLPLQVTQTPQVPQKPLQSNEVPLQLSKLNISVACQTTPEDLNCLSLNSPSSLKLSEIAAIVRDQNKIIQQQFVMIRENKQILKDINEKIDHLRENKEILDEVKGKMDYLLRVDYVSGKNKQDEHLNCEGIQYKRSPRKRHLQRRRTNDSSDSSTSSACLNTSRTPKPSRTPSHCPSFKSKPIKPSSVEAHYRPILGGNVSSVLGMLPTPTTDRSLAMNALAIKYLPENKLREIVSTKTELSRRTPLTQLKASSPNLETNNLCRVENSNETPKSRRNFERNQKILDVTAIKQQPKLM